MSMGIMVEDDCGVGDNEASDLSSTPAGGPTADDVAPARLVRLVDGSPGTAVTVPPEGEGALSVGRTEQLGSCTLLLDDNAVSKRHAVDCVKVVLRASTFGADCPTSHFYKM